MSQKCSMNKDVPSFQTVGQLGVVRREALGHPAAPPNPGRPRACGVEGIGQPPPSSGAGFLPQGLLTGAPFLLPEREDFLLSAACTRLSEASGSRSHPHPPSQTILTAGLFLYHHLSSICWQERIFPVNTGPREVQSEAR